MPNKRKNVGVLLAKEGHTIVQQNIYNNKMNYIYSMSLKLLYLQCILGFDRDLSSQEVFYDLHVGTILKQTILTNAGLIGYEV